MSQAINPTLYPDVAEHGALAAALIDMAGRSSIDLGPLAVGEGTDRYWSAVVATDRGWVSVSLGAQERVFVITAANTTHVWASGTTDKLSEVVQVADLWRKGGTLHELHARFPFMTYNQRAQAYEDGNPVEVEWDSLLQNPDLTTIRPLLLAARADHRMAGLFPSVTMFTTARFAVDHSDRRAGEVLVSLAPDGGYEVFVTWDDEPRRAATVNEAIDVAAALLP